MKRIISFLLFFIIIFINRHYIEVEGIDAESKRKKAKVPLNPGQQAFFVHPGNPNY